MSAPKLSVVVVAFDMARELPRTLRSLSPAMQRGIAAQDYEIVVADNGSREPVDESACRELAPNVRLLRIERAPPSPVRAINQALELARGDLVGVCIDGARMASPGLLARALEASRLAAKPVIGTLSFHLGPDVQPRSVKQGYDARAEDELLERSRWTEDGYRLFSIAVLAPSSRRGWLALPDETNSLFLTREHWRELGGFDERFESPGGGLANLDAWKRACETPGARPILLLGEATFHQVHGGVATNAAVSPAKQFQDEYARLRGERYAPPRSPPLLVGGFDDAAIASLRESLRAREEAALRPAVEALASGRRFRSSVDAATWEAIQAGTMRFTWRGVPCHKSPFDLALYSRLIGSLRPRTIVEVGTKAGGSALWFADALTAHGVDGARVISIDVADPPPLRDPRIAFLRGDAAALDRTLGEELLRSLPKPWLVVEDSSHRHDDVLALLRFFDRHVVAGDYVVVEDGIVSQLPGPAYAAFEDGPNRALARFLAEHPDRYAVATDLCDFFGFNATYNPNAWLRVIGAIPKPPG